MIDSFADEEVKLPVFTVPVISLQEREKDSSIAEVVLNLVKELSQLLTDLMTESAVKQQGIYCFFFSLIIIYGNFKGRNCSSEQVSWPKALKHLELSFAVGSLGSSGGICFVHFYTNKYQLWLKRSSVVRHEITKSYLLILTKLPEE